MRRYLLVIALGWLPGLCLADMYDAEYQKCAQDSTSDTVECVMAQAKQWDKRLNSSYKALMERSEAEQQAALKSAQRLWIRYRDANCGFYGAAAGSISRVLHAACIRAMTKARTCEMQAANRMEGGSSPECQ